jgi:phosphatidylglycerol:prolipoprotein diacylglycerol transferase
MLQHPRIDPVAISIGPIDIHWYGLMYLIAFAACWFAFQLRARKPGSGWSPEMVSDLVFYVALGVVLGGRVGYILFYNFSAFIDSPLILFKVWQGGMSFHGGLLGVILAMYLFARKTGKSIFLIGDWVATVVPLGLGAGRLGNFINGELWGRVTDVPWGMVFAGAGPEPRHPSQLYQFMLEGVLLFVILWVFSSRPRPVMSVTGLFLICYGVFRFAVEFVRQPDGHLGFIAFEWLTMGQLLSFPMIVAGGIFLCLAYRPKPAKA